MQEYIVKKLFLLIPTVLAITVPGLRHDALHPR